MPNLIDETASSATVSIPGSPTLIGDLTIPDSALGIVVFAHGSGSSRLSPRNQRVAARLQRAGFATLLCDLLTPEEEAVDAKTGRLRFDVGLLGARLAHATYWLFAQPETYPLSVGLFGGSTGAAAALIAAAERPGLVHAVVSRGGRPDLAGEHLPHVRAPTLLIVGGEDGPVIDLNREALKSLSSRAKEMRIVPGASHLFEEPGALDQVSRMAEEWFMRFLPERRRQGF